MKTVTRFLFFPAVALFLGLSVSAITGCGGGQSSRVQTSMPTSSGTATPSPSSPTPSSPTGSTSSTSTYDPYVQGVAVNPVTHNAYFAINTYAGTSGIYTGEVLVLDGTTNIVTARIPVGNYADAIVVNPSTNTIYVGNYNDKTVSIINGATNAVIATLAIPINPYAMAINATTNFIYVLNGFSSTMDVINGATNTLSESVDLGVYPQSAAVDETTNTIYLAGMNNATTGDLFETPALYAVNGATFSVSSAVPTGASGNQDFAVVVNEVTDKVYALPSRTGETFVMDGASNAVTGPITTGVQPTSLAVDPATNLVYIADYSNGTVLVLDGGSNTVTTSIQTPSAHLGFVAVDPSSNVIYAANYNSAASVTVINGSSNSIITTVPLQ